MAGITTLIFPSALIFIIFRAGLLLYIWYKSLPMKTADRTSGATKYLAFLFLLIFSFTVMYSQDKSVENVIYWHIKAVLPEARLIDLKAIDKEGRHHDVKAIQDSHDISLLNVKALVNGETLPIKIIVSDSEKYHPVKAIDYEGTILDVKAIGDNGEILDVKGVSRMGNIVEIRAIDKQQREYNVISISPQDGINHVKGLKMFSEEVEAEIHGIRIFAHVKSLRQY